MQKILIVILAILLSVSTCQKKVNMVLENTMVERVDTLSQHQLDSLFVADTLSFNIEDDWIISPVVSEDRKDVLYKYVYIKALTDSTGTIYTLCSYQDTLYILNKRVAK